MDRERQKRVKQIRYLIRRLAAPVIYVLAISVIFLLGYGFVYQQSSIRDSYPIAFVLAVVVFLVYSLSLAMIRGYRFEKSDVQALREERNDLRGFINYIGEAELAGLLATEFKVVFWENIYEIDKRGDTTYTRNVELLANNKPVKYYPITIGLLEGEEISHIDELKIRAVNPVTQKELVWFVVEQTPRLISFVVKLDPVPTINSISECQIEMFWRGLFKPLAQTNIDNCVLTLHSITDVVRLVYYGPVGYEYNLFKISPPDLGSLTITKTAEGKSKLVYEAKEVPEGKYRYQLGWQKAK